MARVYTLPLYDPLNGALVRNLSEAQYQMNINMRLNSAGSLTMILPECDFPITSFDEDQILNVYVRTDGGAQFLLGERAWFLEYFAKVSGEDGSTRIELKFGDGLAWLARRLVAYQSEVAQSEAIAQAADDVMKRVMRQNGGTAITTDSYNAAPDADRSVAGFVGVQANATAAPATTKAFEHENLLTLFQDIAKVSEAAGTRLYFDLPFVNQLALPILEFRTYIGQRGVDRTQATGAVPAIISPGNETVGAYTLAFDYRDTARQAYSGGRGDAGARVFATSTEAVLAAYLATHPMAFREKFINASGLDAGEAGFAAKLQTEADVLLNQSLATVQFDGQITEQDGFRFGNQWNFGDRVTVATDGFVLDVDINALSINIRNGEEKIGASVSNALNRITAPASFAFASQLGSLQRRVGGLERQEIP